MPKEGEIVSTVSVPRSGGGWTEKGSASSFRILSGSKRTTITAAGEFDCVDHAEMRALSCVTATELVTVKLDQNAFPCEKCHAALLKLSATSTITIDVTANKGEYNRCHKISGLTVEEVPVTIVYQAGHATYNGTRDDYRYRA